ncbi:MAG: acyltransferase domain-containing protein, partial [Myxococcota bacterium]
GSAPPLSYAFSMVWEAIFAVLSVDQVAEGLLRLVHQDNVITPGPAWPPAKGDVLDVTSRAVEVEDGASGRRLRTMSVVRRAGELVVELGATFFIRGDYSTTPIARHIEEHLEEAILVSGAAELTLLQDMTGITWSDDISVGDELFVDAEISSRTTRSAQTVSSASGEVRRGGEVVGRLDISELSHQGAHPVHALVSMLAPPALERSTPTKTLASTADLAPEEMTAFAHAGRDYNPIHRGRLIAKLAGLDDVIVHGMWTSARAEAFLTQEVLGGQRERLLAFEATFMAPLECGAAVEFVAERVGRRRGNLLIEVKAMAGGQMVLRAKARVQAPVTAYVFPGQGIQQRGMGMEGYQRSKAARAVWDRADAYTKEALGFSILRIVRTNPTRLIVHGTMHLHPQGVLHLTQFTQVAMAVLASAQVAEMREAGTYVEDAICCGHSVGEYTALGAMSGVLPLEALVALVYQRGQTMHTLVARDAHGASNYRMGVIRPHYAGLKHEDMEELVRELRERSGEFLEIVNYNVKGRQYSVTGTLTALELLQRELSKRMRPGAKPAYIEVPGIDVPFHSRVLADGVAAFRDKLHRTLPPDFNWKPLKGRYIPNLVPRPFSLERDYVEAVHDYTGSEVLADVLEHWEERRKDKLTLTRTFLIELLAWQFASPVRWIETQDLLFAPEVLGGMGAHHVVEIGVGYQPTLANMAKYTLSLPATVAGDVEVRNIEA